jgi:hypothetical protein
MMKDQEKIQAKNPFKVPENYFEEVNRKILLSTAGTGEEKTEKTLYRKLRPYLAVAASVAFLAMLGVSALLIFNSGNNQKNVPQISLNEFTSNYLNDIDILTLEENAASIDPEHTIATLNRNDIIDYFVFENIDINDIYEQP